MTAQSMPAHTTGPMQRVTVPGGTISYQQTGSGFPLLLLHGWGASSGYWENTLQSLSDSYTCYAPDLPGYGRSSLAATSSASAEHLADMILAFADALHLKQFDLIGHSFGGAVATYIATRFPDRVRHLILTCFGTFGTDLEYHAVAYMYFPTDLWFHLCKPWLLLWQPWTTVMQAWMAQFGCETRMYESLAQPFFHRMPEDEDLLCKGLNDIFNMDYRVAIESALSLANPEIFIALRELSVPTLLIGTRQDRMIVPSRVEGTAQLIPRCRVAWIDECGHIPMIERPHAYHQVVRNFLAG